MYNLYINEYDYVYDTLEDACERICKTLIKYNVSDMLLKGTFESTLFTGLKDSIPKIKIYKIDANPFLKIKLHKKSSESMDEKHILYILNKTMERLKNENYNN